MKTRTLSVPGPDFQTWESTSPDSPDLLWFSTVPQMQQSERGLWAAERLDLVKGTGFSPYINAAESTRALAQILFI
jgi:hypothetical protein